MWQSRALMKKEMFNLVKNLLVIANLLLIRDYGVESSSYIRFEADGLAKKEEYEMGSKDARETIL